MIVRPTLRDAQLESALGRVSPLTKLTVAVVWLLGLAFTTQHAPPTFIAVVALGSGVTLGHIPIGTLGRAIAPLWAVAAVVVISNIAFGAANTDPTATEIVRIGPLRVTSESVATATALGLRVVAIASVGAVFALTTDSTRLADSLVQQAGLSPRFAYGALAAYQAVPRFGEDLTTLRQARRLRGLRGGWHPRLLVGLLVLAIRHGDRVALAMDARAFGSAPRTRYREIRWGPLDVVIAVVAAVVLAIALALGS
jgi:ABC-type cobalt transport system, permease component CbiQ and related transporters